MTTPKYRRTPGRRQLPPTATHKQWRACLPCLITPCLLSPTRRRRRGLAICTVGRRGHRTRGGESEAASDRKARLGRREVQAHARCTTRTTDLPVGWQAGEASVGHMSRRRAPRAFLMRCKLRPRRPTLDGRMMKAGPGRRDRQTDPWRRMVVATCLIPKKEELALTAEVIVPRRPVSRLELIEATGRARRPDRCVSATAQARTLPLSKKREQKGGRRPLLCCRIGAEGSRQARSSRLPPPCLRRGAGRGRGHSPRLRRRDVVLSGDPNLQLAWSTFPLPLASSLSPPPPRPIATHPVRTRIGSPARPLVPHPKGRSAPTRRLHLSSSCDAPALQAPPHFHLGEPCFGLPSSLTLLPFRIPQQEADRPLAPAW